MEIIFVSKRNFIQGISAVAQSRAANLRDLCGILAASASKDLGHAEFLACVGRELIMKRESVEGCFRWLCYCMASRQNNNLWNTLMCHSDKFQWLCPCSIPLASCLWRRHWNVPRAENITRRVPNTCIHVKVLALQLWLSPSNWNWPVQK